MLKELESTTQNNPLASSFLDPWTPDGNDPTLFSKAL